MNQNCSSIDNRKNTTQSKITSFESVFGKKIETDTFRLADISEYDFFKIENGLSFELKNSRLFSQGKKEFSISFDEFLNLFSKEEKIRFLNNLINVEKKQELIDFQTTLKDGREITLILEKRNKSIFISLISVDGDQDKIIQKKIHELIENTHLLKSTSKILLTNLNKLNNLNNILSILKKYGIDILVDDLLSKEMDDNEKKQELEKIKQELEKKEKKFKKITDTDLNNILKELFEFFYKIKSIEKIANDLEKCTKHSISSLGEEKFTKYLQKKQDASCEKISQDVQRKRKEIHDIKGKIFIIQGNIELFTQIYFPKIFKKINEKIFLDSTKKLEEKFYFNEQGLANLKANLENLVLDIIDVFLKINQVKKASGFLETNSEANLISFFNKIEDKTKIPIEKLYEHTKQAKEALCVVGTCACDFNIDFDEKIREENVFNLSKIISILNNLIINSSEAIQEHNITNAKINVKFEKVNCIQLNKFFNEIDYKVGKPIPNPSYLLISIEDNAGGLPRTIQDEIFNNSIQSLKTSKINGNGVGLKSVVEYALDMNCIFGYKIKELENNNKGTSFYLAIPIIY